MENLEEKKMTYRPAAGFTTGKNHYTCQSATGGRARLSESPNLNPRRPRPLNASADGHLTHLKTPAYCIHRHLPNASTDLRTYSRNIQTTLHYCGHNHTTKYYVCVGYLMQNLIELRSLQNSVLQNLFCLELIIFVVQKLLCRSFYASPSNIGIILQLVQSH